MIEQGWQRLDVAVRRVMPLASVFVASLLGVVVMPLPYYGTVSPLLSLVAIFFWAVYRPDLVRPAGVFIVGILNDCIHNYPIGTSALIFVGLYQATIMQRRLLVNFDFRLMWIGFAIATTLYVIGMWCLMSMLNMQWISPIPLIIQALLTITLFPLPVLALLALHKLVMGTS